ncbi:putative bifunctional diguanylate cyclase/phosphodiesterase [Nitriliruptor alkaliphilus]|uniref:putative bifunctional diguanylate cyclase/phosphodiesterase n=1 Tax=Nitriliruptor alkaliphilus TaxID=427918 RepID=UPI000695D579|nr:EAL domain-containing protein [Nitriliruptor alkaliphilus]
MTQDDDLDELLGLLKLIPEMLHTFGDLDSADLDVGIDDALRRIGTFAGVDRSYLFTFDAEHQVFDNTNEWCAPGIEPQMDQLQRVDVDLFATWIDRFLAGEFVYIPSVAGLPDDRREEHDVLAGQGIQSLVTVPLLANTRLVGFLGFDAVVAERNWSDGALMLLRAVGDVICGGLMRREAFQAVSQREERFRALIEHSSDAVMILATDASIHEFGPSTERVLGWADTEPGTQRYLDRVHPDDHAHVDQALRRATMRPGTNVAVPDHRLQHADGSWRWFLATAIDLTDLAAVEGVVLNVHEITSRKAAEEALQHQALHDPLTDLPNRSLLLDRLQVALARTDRGSGSVGVIFLDLDRFKLINDSLGHAIGDELLVEVAHRLTALVRPGDTVARLGGDEFVIVIDQVPDDATAQLATRRLLAAFGDPFRLRGRDHVVTASAGLVLAERRTGTDRTPDSLLRDADAAMYQAKEHGRARVERFDGALRERLLRRVQLAQDLRGAIERGELHLDYQPLMTLDGDTVTGVEALLRWTHPAHGAVSPSEFIPVAEDHGLIVPIGRWVLDTALGQLARWSRSDTALRNLTVSVNVSVQQLTADDLTATVTRLLATHDIAPERLYLELTESALMTEPEAGRQILGQLRRAGVQLAIDDFGTGYSSLAYLRELPVTTLKIDRSFITRLGSNARDERLVAAIINLAHELDLTVVAEGVETVEQLTELRRRGCDVIQGFHLQRPCPPDELERTLRARTHVDPHVSRAGSVR